MPQPGSFRSGYRFLLSLFGSLPPRSIPNLDCLFYRVNAYQDHLDPIAL
jgi:hypothetical protein